MPELSCLPTSLSPHLIGPKRVTGPTQIGEEGITNDINSGRLGSFVAIFGY